MAIVSVRISSPAINEYWHLSRRIDADELGAFVLAGDEVYRHRVELDTEFLEKPSHARGSPGVALVVGLGRCFLGCPWEVGRGPSPPIGMISGLDEPDSF